MSRQELVNKAAMILQLIERYEAINQPHHAERYRKMYREMKKALA